MAAKRNFDLNKKSARSFDLGKESISRKFDLSKDSDDISVENIETDSENHLEETSSNRNNLKWLLIALGVIIIGLLIWWLIPTSNIGAKEETENDIPENVVTTTDENVENNNSENSVNEEVAPVVEEEVQSEEVVVDTPEQDVTKAETTPDNQTSPPKPTVIPSNSINDSVTTANVSNDIETEALKVIRGDYGIGQERKDRLGNKYQTIQNRVNQLKKEGVF